MRVCGRVHGSVRSCGPGRGSGSLWPSLPTPKSREGEGGGRPGTRGSRSQGHPKTSGGGGVLDRVPRCPLSPLPFGPELCKTKIKEFNWGRDGDQTGRVLGRGNPPERPEASRHFLGLPLLPCHRPQEGGRERPSSGRRTGAEREWRRWGAAPVRVAGSRPLRLLGGARARSASRRNPGA